MHNATLERILAAPNLPTLPAVAMKVLELTNKPDVSLKQVASVIENDQAIASKVLRTINSSFYGLPKRCASIQQALTLLGLQTVKGLVLGFSMAQSIDGGGERDISFDFMSYWRRSMYSAAAAKHIASVTRRCDPDEAFVAALIQDVGMVALWRAFDDRYLQTLDAAGKQHRKLAALERKSFETDHMSISAELVRRWRFPTTVIDAVRWHQESSGASVESMAIARVVELAGMAASAIIGDGGSADEAVQRYRTAGHEWFDIKGNQPVVMLQAIADLAHDLARVFGLNVGEQPDVDAILARAEKIRTEQELPNLNIDAMLAAEARDNVDASTGLPDKSVFLRDLDAAFAQSAAGGTGSGIGLLLIALDDAKSLNERHGPAAGDSALTAVAELVTDAIGKFGRPYRFVGAAFAALLPKTDIEQLCRIGEALRRRIAESVIRIDTAKGPDSARCTVTCGAAICESDAAIRAASGVTNRDELIRAAILALSNGQANGCNRVVLHRGEQRRSEAA
jgi:diguanylate cyclase (GGDEF)-like protein